MKKLLLGAAMALVPDFINAPVGAVFNLNAFGRQMYPDYDEKGLASWYGEQFHNRNTANGEVFDMDRITAAHKTLPLPSIVEVTDLDTGKKLKVRVNDRGPFVSGRIIDLSKGAAKKLGIYQRGVARVRVRYIGPG